MNHIDVVEIKTQYGYYENFWTIDGVALPTVLDSQIEDAEDVFGKMAIKSFADLCPAWNYDLDWMGDVRFVWKLIDMDNAPLPLFLCPEDADFSCVVIVAEAVKTKDFVYWNRIGYVSHDGENFEEEKRSGILAIDKYSDDDWEKYGDNIALASVDSEEWKQWISKHWDEELYRRRMNYTLPFYQKEENIKWFAQTNWAFDRYEYERMVFKFKTMQCKKYLDYLKEETSEKINIYKCANILSDTLPNGEMVLENHIKNYGEILLHVLAAELITEPLIELLKHNDKNAEAIELYCKMIELMWAHGDASVVNVVDVTILERLSDEQEMWKKFGTYLTNDFKHYSVCCQ